MRLARSCYDHLAGQLGVELADVALHRGWVIADGADWHLAAGAASAASQALGLDIRLDDPAAGTANRPALRPCRDWSEGRPHLAGRFGAAVLRAMVDAGWLARTPGGRALKLTELGTQRLWQTGIHGLLVDEDGCDQDTLCITGGVSVRAAGGQDWGQVVESAASRDWVGLAPLAGFSGSVSAAVSENYSAYGAQVSDVVASVRTWDRLTDRQCTFAMTECEFRPGGSRFSARDGQRRYEVLEVAFLFRLGSITPPVSNPALIQLLGVQPGARMPLTRVREAVLAAAR